MSFKISRHHLGLVLALLSAALFGIYPPAVRAVYTDGGNVVFMMLATMWSRALGLTGFCLITRKRLFKTMADTRQAFVGGFFQAFSACGVMVALSMIPGPIVIMVIFTHTLALLFFLVWKKEAILDAPTLLTTLVALVGLSFVLDLYHAQPQSSIIGISIAFVAAMAIVLRMYVYGKQTKARNPAIVGAENFLMAACFTILTVIYKLPVVPTTVNGFGWASMACLTMAVATFMMFYGISYLGAFGWSLLGKIEPIFTAVFSVILIHEFLKSTQYIGMLIVIGSLVYYQIKSQPYVSRTANFIPRTDDKF